MKRRKQKPLLEDDSVDSLSEALLYGFDWQETPEGKDFWKDLRKWTINPNQYSLPILKPE